MKKFFIIFLTLSIFSSCSLKNKNSEEDNMNVDNFSNAPTEFKPISQPSDLPFYPPSSEGPKESPAGF
ncbi:MAG: hypothetical protein UR27_C0015G0012 [Candidatus Peregrinibacteria bacterium GW2011_GWA2_33_10]|nr:MAG: hypothetical protein UR27_C0015G0012 [Candidatus Peregrinibacteria bacterium GW2011_GWA2_33_10]KKP39515.1 MAG: hypothetical protein UR30_C0010G0011 [Candidatus Peregrinibacteria bacterium GW2011_GWC2_33_13]OGJ49892.1 MAG: hypothetical protein A2229_01145 [Candidatus Peregrinibacteria bacterium RIFOXYA2_FULL_33_7]